MDDSARLCREIRESAYVGKAVLSRLIKRCKDASFRSVMADMFASYHCIFEGAGALLARQRESGSSAAKKLKEPILFGIALNTAVDASASHLAEMLVQGCAMSLINIARAQNEFARADPAALELSKRALRKEYENIQSLLKFV